LPVSKLTANTITFGVAGAGAGLSIVYILVQKSSWNAGTSDTGPAVPFLRDGIRNSCDPVEGASFLNTFHGHIFKQFQIPSFMLDLRRDKAERRHPGKPPAGRHLRNPDKTSHSSYSPPPPLSGSRREHVQWQENSWSAMPPSNEEPLIFLLVSESQEMAATSYPSFFAALAEEGVTITYRFSQNAASDSFLFWFLYLHGFSGQTHIVKICLHTGETAGNLTLLINKLNAFGFPPGIYQCPLWV
jgi:hypothetical protein